MQLINTLAPLAGEALANQAQGEPVANKAAKRSTSANPHQADL